MYLKRKYRPSLSQVENYILELDKISYNSFEILLLNIYFFLLKSRYFVLLDTAHFIMKCEWNFLIFFIIVNLKRTLKIS